ncbi:tetratricopeptide repeat protein [Conservatibacter flavescens]|uniref:CapZB protein n=1 Tax=Conservatibacter flavescens TaxID=28161 RepID=A0A2M8S4X2_9PAST|nr:tetratricopeptide repeat protein [Conservatibacter flavescens]PJG86148.1 capZB protein [Conservatibacter flavescens]
MKPLRSALISKYQHAPFVQRCLQIKHHIAGTRQTRGVHAYLYLYQMAQAFETADHVAIHQLADKMLQKGDPLGHLYLAKSHLLTNDNEQAKAVLSRFLAENPHHAEATYLLAEIYVRLSDKAAAWQCLQELLAHSKRGKTWQHLSNLVDTPSEFERFCTLFAGYFPDYQTKALPFDIASHLSNAATRAGDTGFALELWRRQYRLGEQVKNLQKSTALKQYTDKKAAAALAALKQCLDHQQVEFFLISGTLLGCIREGKLLGHDKDIDVGVWETHTVQDLARMIRQSGCFYILPIYSQDILVVRHVSGITIDIFIHHRDDGDYWHAGGKTKWSNSPFELTYRRFLGQEYLIPKDYGQYLTENYGADWQIPKTDFDSALDTPNVHIISEQEFIIYLYKKIISAAHSDRRNRYIKTLRLYGENV